jgi:acyl-CoA synthetase (AMP-forming)/AMP-acid ligase II
MSRKIKEELQEILPEHTRIYIMYGATEASARLTYLEPDYFAQKIESIGRAIPGVVMKVLDNNGQEAPAGVTGELVGSGSNIMRGYWKDEEATKEVLDQNGYHTGDMGYKDEDGFFYVVGRQDNLLKVGGHRINTQEIEDAFMETDLVLEAVVIGIPDELLGNRLIALSVPLKEDCTEAQILELLAKKLPKYKLPGEVKMLRALPKSSSGKIDKAKCVELATPVEY